jgi:hypothetical protein
MGVVGQRGPQGKDGRSVGLAGGRQRAVKGPPRGARGAVGHPVGHPVGSLGWHGAPGVFGGCACQRRQHGGADGPGGRGGKGGSSSSEQLGRGAAPPGKSKPGRWASVPGVRAFAGKTGPRERPRRGVRAGWRSRSRCGRTRPPHGSPLLISRGLVWSGWFLIGRDDPVASYKVIRAAISARASSASSARSSAQEGRILRKWVPARALASGHQGAPHGQGQHGQGQHKQGQHKQGQG